MCAADTAMRVDVTMDSFLSKTRLAPACAVRALQRGFTIIELMVGIAIVAAALYFAVPSMSAWIQSSQIRSATESIQGALQLARAEAVQRNTAVEVVLTSVAEGGRAADWLVRCVTSSPTCPGTGQPGNTFIQQRLGAEGAANAVVSVNPAISSIAFSGNGRITPVPAGNIVIDVAHVSNDPPATDTCLAGGGDFRCLRLVVAPGGQMRMCDPSVAAPNPRAC